MSSTEYPLKHSQRIVNPFKLQPARLTPTYPLKNDKIVNFSDVTFDLYKRNMTSSYKSHIAQRYAMMDFNERRTLRGIYGIAASVNSTDAINRITSGYCDSQARIINSFTAWNDPETLWRNTRFTKTAIGSRTMSYICQINMFRKTQQVDGTPNSVFKYYDPTINFHGFHDVSSANSGGIMYEVNQMTEVEKLLNLQSLEMVSSPSDFFSQTEKFLNSRIKFKKSTVKLDKDKKPVEHFDSVTIECSSMPTSSELEDYLILGGDFTLDDESIIQSRVYPDITPAEIFEILELPYGIFEGGEAVFNVSTSLTNTYLKSGIATASNEARKYAPRKSGADAPPTTTGTGGAPTPDPTSGTRKEGTESNGRTAPLGDGTLEVDPTVDPSSSEAIDAEDGEGSS